MAPGRARSSYSTQIRKLGISLAVIWIGYANLVEQYPRTGDIYVSDSYSEIDDVLYSVSKDGALRWYDTDKTRWRDLAGLPNLPSPLPGYGGAKMMVFWNINLSGHLFQSDTIFCAEIALERRNGDCWGKLEWYGSVLSVPVDTELVKVLAVKRFE